MSKTQDKRAQRKAEHEAFIKQRRQQELVMLQMQFQRGLELYEANKDKMSEEEIEIMEREKQKFLDHVEQFKKDNGLDEEPQG